MSGRDNTTRLLREAVWIDTPETRKTVHKLKKYGLTPRQYEWLGHAQAWRCLGCDAFTRNGHHLRIDHCHETGVVRGLLCHSCNISLGWARDNPKTLRKLAAYLDSVAPERANDP